MKNRFTHSSPTLAALVGVLILALFVAPALAVEVTTAPYEGFAIFDASDPGYVSIPDHPDLEPMSAITLEAWVNFSPNLLCNSIIGKGYLASYWMGVCGTTFTSWIGGELIETVQIEVPIDTWVHLAMTSDGTTRRHYINGSLVSEEPELGSLINNTNPVQIGKDPDWFVNYDGAIDEVRLWNRALSTEEIRDYSRFALQYAVPGLVAVWDFGPNDVFGNHDGVIVGSLGGLTNPLGSCSNTSSTMCLADRFTVTVDWNTNSDSGTATAVPPNSKDTGLFWFFAPDNWEVMVKVLNVCGFLNDRVWVYIAASTDQGYKITVRDSLTGQSVEYNKAVGPPAPAITDTNALDVCNPF